MVFVIDREVNMKLDRRLIYDCKIVSLTLGHRLTPKKEYFLLVILISVRG
jgi:hypothetical protein